MRIFAIAISLFASLPFSCLVGCSLTRQIDKELGYTEAKATAKVYKGVFGSGVVIDLGSKFSGNSTGKIDPKTGELLEWSIDVDSDPGPVMREQYNRLGENFLAFQNLNANFQTENHRITAGVVMHVVDKAVDVLDRYGPETASQVFGSLGGLVPQNGIDLVPLLQLLQQQSAKQDPPTTVIE